jgi:hypothetical protein
MFGQRMRIAMTVPRLFMGGALWHQRAASDKSGYGPAGDRYGCGGEIEHDVKIARPDAAQTLRAIPEAESQLLPA